MADRSGWGFHKGLSVALLARVGTLKKNKNEIASALSAWHQSRQIFWFSLNAQLLLPHCSKWQVSKALKSQSDVHCHLSTPDQGTASIRGRGEGTTWYTYAHTGAFILGDRMLSHPWAQRLLEFPAHHYWSFQCRTGNQTKIHRNISLYTVFRCSVNYKHLGRIEIRFSTNQCELNYESISMSELRKDFLGPWRDAKCMTLKKWLFLF